MHSNLNKPLNKSFESFNIYEKLNDSVCFGLKVLYLFGSGIK